jgi:hypothetical protein
MKNKKKIGIAALVATLSAAFICSSLTPTFAAANTDNNNVSIPNTLENGKEITTVLTKDEVMDKYEIEIDDENIMILYTDNTYDIVKNVETMYYNYYNEDYNNAGTLYVINNIDSIHAGWFEPQQEVEICWDFDFHDTEVMWDDLGYVSEDKLQVFERTYDIYIDGELVCQTNDPQVVKSYGFIGKLNTVGHYVGWVYQEGADENTDDILVEYDAKQDKPRQVLYKSDTMNNDKPNGSVFVKKGKYDVCIVAKGYGKHKAYFINGVIIESGELPEETETPVEPTEPEETEKPVEPTEPEETEKPVEPTEPEETEKPVEPTEPIIITTKEHDNNAKEAVMLVFRLPNNFEDDTEITTPTVDIKKLESEVIEAERIASEARAEADRLTAIANEKRAALEAARQ